MKEIQEYLKLKADIYKFLGKAFYKEADGAYLEELKKYMQVLNTISQNTPNELIDEGISHLEAFYRSITDINDAVGSLELEFAQNFLGTTMLAGRRSVTPHESVYRSSRGLAMQEQRDQVLEIYYGEGVGTIDGFTEPEDHISAEMGFMAFLSTRSVQFIADGEYDRADENMKLQQSFLNEHILPWVPKMCAELRALSSVYYKGIAYLTEGFLLYDDAVLKELQA